MMLPDQKDRECFINLVWDTELKGGISISEYSAFLAEDAATAFVSGAYIATILVCCSAIESHLKFDGGHGYNLFELSSNFGLKMDLVNDIDRVRQFRNSWVHVSDPENDSLLQ